MCGGPTHQQKTAAQGLSAEQQALLKETTQELPVASSVYNQEATQGLPYFNQQAQYSTSDLANQINLAKAGAKGREAGFGDALPSGFAEQEQADIGTAGAKAFDQNMMSLLAQQFAAKQAGAAGAAGLATGSAGTSAGAGQAVVNAPLQNNFWSNLISGLVQGAAHAPVPIPA
jgi:hypothetical protein